jgi:hypothetical protein
MDRQTVILGLVLIVIGASITRKNLERSLGRVDSRPSVASSQDAKRLEIGGLGTFGARRIGAPCGARLPALITIVA